MTITIDSTSYEVAHQFSETRCLIIYDGLYVFADRNPDGTWDLSGEPARKDEMPVLKSFTDPLNDQTIVTVTKN
jgi:hypothetical protein